MSKEVLLVVESVSNEKGVPASVIFEALELAEWRASFVRQVPRGRCPVHLPARRRHRSYLGRDREAQVRAGVQGCGALLPGRAEGD